MSEVITIDNVARLEGHASVAVYFDDVGNLESAEYIATEPSRAFDVIMEGKHASEIPRLACRICGICYTPHNICACKALEDAWGVEVPHSAVKIRELINYANTLSSHALHVFFLAGPGLLLDGVNTIADLKRRYPDFVNAGLHLRKVGQDISEIISGRKVHTAISVPGGVRRTLGKTEMDGITRLLDTADGPMDLLRRCFWELMEKKEDYLLEFGRINTHFVGLPQGERFEICEGPVELRTKDGEVKHFTPSQFLDRITESEREYSYVRHPYLTDFGPEGGQFRVGPLARIQGGSWHNSAFRDFKKCFGELTQSTMGYHIARVAEMVECLSEMRKIAHEGVSNDIKNTAEPKKGVGTAVIEAPRGLLLHHYETNDDGIVTRVRVIAPTTFHQGSIERSTYEAAKKIFGDSQKECLDEDKVKIEHVIRAYDPCMSCAGATQLRVIKRPEIAEDISRRC